MSIESEIFKRYSPDFNKLEKYGFIKSNGVYTYETEFADNNFHAGIKIFEDGRIEGTVFDKENNEEFYLLRLENPEGGFIGEIKQEYINILTSIRDKCFYQKYFVTSQANRIAEKIIKKYGDVPVFMWKKFPTYGVFKNQKSNKWYGIIMYIEFSKLSEPSDDFVEIINLKLNKNEIPELIKKDGIYPAWHMNKKYWVSVLLNETLKDDEIMRYIEQSHDLCCSGS